MVMVTHKSHVNREMIDHFRLNGVYMEFSYIQHGTYIEFVQCEMLFCPFKCYNCHDDGTSVDFATLAQHHKKGDVVAVTLI